MTAKTSANVTGVFDLETNRLIGLAAKGTGDVTYLAGQDEPTPQGAMPVTAITDPLTGRIRKSAGGQYVDMLQISSKKIPTLGAIGDSIVEVQYGNPNLGGLVGEIRRFTGHRAFGDKVCYMLGGLVVPDVYAFEGYSGKQTHEILALAKSKTATMTYGVSDTIKVGIAARAPTFTLEVSGTNDISFAYRSEIESGAALRRCVAGRRALWAYIRACGSEPIALSLLPCQGLWSGSDMTQEQLKPYRQIWNAAIKAAAEADGVAWVDAYTPCASPDGGWKTDYIRHNGQNDEGGIHPFMLATEAIALAIKPVLANLIGAAPYVPRIELGGSAIYSAAFANDGLRQYFANFDTGLFPSLAGWSIRYNPQSAGSQSLAPVTQDISGGGTYRAQLVSSGSNLVLTTGPQITVSAGQEYLFFADIDADHADVVTAMSLVVADVTSGSGSLWQPVRAFDFSTGQEAQVVKTGVRRVMGIYTVPTGINKVAVQLSITTSGTSGSLSSLRVSNIGQLRLA